MSNMQMLPTNERFNVTEWGCGLEDGSYYVQTGDVQPVQTFIPTTQRVCSGDIHVFPCQRCNTCQCGKATVKR